MPPLSTHHSSKITKLLLLGESGSGKTGALASLAGAGFNLRILDLDNGIDVLYNYLRDPKSSYPKEALDRVTAVTLTEKMRNINGAVVPASATVWPKAMALLTEWKDTDAAGQPISLGKLETWGENDVLVIDSLTMLSTAAMNFQLSLQGKLMGGTTQNEHRRLIGAAQQAVENMLMLLYDSSVKCNIVVTSHIVFVDEQGAMASGTDANGASLTPKIGYPSALGKALSPRIPRYFNSMLLAQTIGSGAATRHKIFTVSQGVVGAKSSAPLKVLRDYPLETGLADYFKAIRS